MRNIYSAILVFLFVIMPLELSAQSKVATTAANFLQIGVGARGTALGGAASASGRDISSLYWNPALIAGINNSEIYFNNTQWFAGIDLNYGSALINLGDIGNFAVTFYSLATDQIEVTTEEYPDGSGDLYTVQDIMVSISYARSLTDRFSIGSSIKYIQEQIWNNSASAFAVDVGLTYTTPFEPVTIGMSISNFGSEMQMSGTDNAVRFDPDLRVGGNNDGVVADQHTRHWDLPILFRFGFAYQAYQSELHEMLLLGDVLYPSSQENYVNMGVEYGFQNKFFLRGGFRQIFLGNREGGFTAGAGINLYKIRLDYAYSDRGILNQAQYFSVGIRF